MSVIATYRSPAAHTDESTELKIVHDKHGLSVVINNSKGPACACSTQPFRVAPPEQAADTAELFEKLLEVAAIMNKLRSASVPPAAPPTSAVST